MKTIEQLQHEPHGHIARVGKHDALYLADALQEDGKDTVLRLCLWSGSKHTTPADGAPE